MRGLIFPKPQNASNNPDIVWFHSPSNGLGVRLSCKVWRTAASCASISEAHTINCLLDSISSIIIQHLHQKVEDDIFVEVS